MPQETNLNVAPYFDDVGPESNYYKVLFKPGFPIQARELNNLQSILQNQVEDVGNHLFKEGAKVIPGNTTYLSNYSCVQIDSDFLGIPVSLYIDQLVGKTIVGEQTGVTAKVENYITDAQSVRGTFTLYLDYLSSGTDDETSVFADNENLIVDEDIVFATNFISAGEGCAKAIANEATSEGSAYALSQGVYFLRGYFVDVADQVIILDQYTNTPSYRIGFYVNEEVISSEVDPTLTDNAQGFNNFTAPGADRFRVTATLQKKDLDDTDDKNFVQIALIENGLNRDIKTTTDYNILGDELAKRTFDESGDYYVKEFLTTVNNSLANGFAEGIYNANQTTSSGNTPSDDLAIYRISAGKAYVKGFEVDVKTNTLLDIPKPRTTKDVENTSVNFNFGPTFAVNRVYGCPTIGLTTSLTVSLRDQRGGANQHSASGNEIGLARIYDFALESGSYNTSSPQQNVWDLSLFDIDTYADLTLNASTTLSVPTRIEGKQSGATGFLRYAVSAGTAITAYSIDGEFVKGEELLFNGVEGETAFTTNVINHKVADVQSVQAAVGTGFTFSADIVPSVSRNLGIASITKTGGGISTVSSPKFSNTGTGFVGVATVGDLVSFSQGTSGDINFARVTSSSLSTLTIEPVTTVAGICNGALPNQEIVVQNFSVLKTQRQATSSGNVEDTSDTFYSVFDHENVSDVDVEGSSIVIRRQFETTITNGNTGSLTAGTNQVFLPFDEERYAVVKNNGTLLPITSDNIQLTSGNTVLRFVNLSSNGKARVISTLRKSKVKPKVKVNNRTQSIIIDKSTNPQSGTGGTTLNDGLIYGDYPFGTRVQDEVISLNVCDGILVHGVFESNDASDPQSPSMTLLNMGGPTATTNDIILSDIILGETSGARAIYVNKISDTAINFIYLNDGDEFEDNEPLVFEKSGVTAFASNVAENSKNLTSAYKFSNGQKGTHYDFATIIFDDDSETEQPNNKLRVYFSNATFNADDDGDITTVNSYNDFDYSYEIPDTDGLRNSDIIDGRPRVAPYTVSAGSRSPLEFLGRDFSAGNHSTQYVLTGDESINVNKYSYYQGRIDALYLTKQGEFTVVQGSPDDEPEEPDAIQDAIQIARISLPPYLYLPTQADVNFIDYKRYQMNDIAKLEQRIENLEYYSALNLLESNAKEMFIPDENGLNKFKSGIFVDDFQTRKGQEFRNGIKNSIWKKWGLLRSAFYCTALNLTVADNRIAGIGNTTDRNMSADEATLLGTNVKRNAKMLTLDYDERVWIDQPYATRSESVTPFLVKFYNGVVELEPQEDIWIDVTNLAARNIMREGNFAAVAQSIGARVRTRADGTRVGWTPVEWESWETTDVQTRTSLAQSSSQSRSLSWRRGNLREFNSIRQATLGHPLRRTPAPRSFLVQEERVNTHITTRATTTTTQRQTRTGTQQIVREQIDTQSLGNRVVRRETIQFLRERNIEFTAKRMKPNTRLYAFFDETAIAPFVFPKLLNVAPFTLRGAFRPGETCRVYARRNGRFRQTAQIRIANPNHKFGPIRRPTDVYTENPYNRNTNIPGSYTPNSTILNIDTDSLQSEEFDQFEGFIRPGYIIVGRSSRAVCRVRNTNLVTDNNGTLIGAFYVPPSVGNNPRFETGKSNFRLTSSSTDSQVEGTFSTAGDAEFLSSGSLDVMQETTLSVRNARIETRNNFRQNRTLRRTSTSTSRVTVPGAPNLTGVFRDPLAQSFAVDDETGVFLSSVDIYFQEKPSNRGLPVTLEIREMELGTPSPKILAFSTVVKRPNEIALSQDSTVATNFKFKSPVYLNGLKEYCVVLLSNDTGYRVWISRLGEVDVRTLGREAGQVLVSQQPTLGSLFKSQNASTWTPSQYEDLKFRLNRCSFRSSGNVTFVNPDLPKRLENLPDNRACRMVPQVLNVGIGTTLNAETLAGLKPGCLVTQDNTRAEGRFKRVLGAASTVSMTVTRPGAGYTPSAGIQTFVGVAFTAFRGLGENAVGTVTIENGVAIAASITSGGTGFRDSDIVLPLPFGADQVGSGARFTINSTDPGNMLRLNPCQGRFSTNPADILRYTTDTGITTTINSDTGVPGAEAPTLVRQYSAQRDGTFFRIRHRNHGMHQYNNVVELKDFKSDVPTSTLTVDYDADSTGTISVGNTADFGMFENVSVSSTNPGYVRIRDEIIKYEIVTSAGLGTITRGVDDTEIGEFDAGTVVEKYELNFCSLRRINTTHNLNSTENFAIMGRRERDQLSADHYWIKIDFSDTTRGVDRSVGNPGGFRPLAFRKTMRDGADDNSKATYNLPFDSIRPRMNIMTPTLTNVSAFVRTVSGSSVSGNEVAFIDQGLQEIALEKRTRFPTTRCVASKHNEDEYVSVLSPDLPGSKSFQMQFNLETADERLSPVLDLNKMSVRFIANRINAPNADVGGYEDDYRIKHGLWDEHHFYYCTKQVNLENPATSLKVIVDGYVPNGTDVRALYALDQDENMHKTVFTLFPGYGNINESGGPIDPELSSGRSDKEIPKIDTKVEWPALSQYKEYTFTVENVESFNSFRVKLVMSSENQSLSPVFRNLRVIATA